MQTTRLSCKWRGSHLKEIDYITKVTVELSVCLISYFEKCLITTHIHVPPPSSAVWRLKFAPDGSVSDPP